MFSPACSSVNEISPGLVVAVAAEPPSSPTRDADGSLMMSTDLGYLVKLTRAYLVPTGCTDRRGGRRSAAGRAEGEAHGFSRAFDASDQIRQYLPDTATTGPSKVWNGPSSAGLRAVIAGQRPSPEPFASSGLVDELEDGEIVTHYPH
jgi:hypothetical protein